MYINSYYIYIPLWKNTIMSMNCTFSVTFWNWFKICTIHRHFSCPGLDVMNVHELYIFGNWFKNCTIHRHFMKINMTFSLHPTLFLIVSNFVQSMGKIVLGLYKNLTNFALSVDGKNQPKSVRGLYKTSVDCRNRPWIVNFA